MFQGLPSYWRYRTLRLASPMMQGEDVYALQTAMRGLGSGVADPGAVDGILGPMSERAIRRAQAHLSIAVDGLAGGGTQTALCRVFATAGSVRSSLPDGLVFGQLSHESSCRLGNYSDARVGGSYDAGAAQRNTAYTPPREGFDVPVSIEVLCVNLRSFFDKYVGVDSRRRWELAAGAWNAPAYANWIARSEGATRVRESETLQPGPTARQRLEEYMVSATAFMR